MGHAHNGKNFKAEINPDHQLSGTLFYENICFDIITQNTTHSNIMCLYRDHSVSTSFGNAGKGVGRGNNKK